MASPADAHGTFKPSGASEAIKYVALALIAWTAFGTRLFSVVKYESVIHEFDPYFNFRVTKFALTEGISTFWDWFDARSWYPLGRIVGGTMYPGLPITSIALHWVCENVLLVPVDIKDVCVMIGPIFSVFTVIVTYLLVKEAKNDGAGLVAAAFVALVPSYISRSVAGSYDCESVAIFALTNVFYTYSMALKTGSMMWGALASLSYLYMVASWGGYTFVINLIPIHALALLLSNRFSAKLYTAYTQFVLTGTLIALCVPVVGFNAVGTSEHYSGFFVFLLMNVVAATRYLKGALSERAYESAYRSFVRLCFALFGACSVVVVLFALTSPTLRWSGRSLSLLDPTYATKYIPIIASVSEHQAPIWTNFVGDLRMPLLMTVAGIASCFNPMTDTSLLLVVWAALVFYFTAVMVRLMLVLAPVTCCLAGIAVSEALAVMCKSVKVYMVLPDEEEEEEEPSSSKARKAARRKGKAEAEEAGDWGLIPGQLALAGIFVIAAAMIFQVFHGVFLSAEGYSSPSIILLSRTPSGGTHVFDDYREAFSWLRENTPYDAKVASWWDYGYQTSEMADRSVIVDNNTWNNTHIATVGLAMASDEEKAWRVLKSLDVSYVFVVFGALVGYSSDDINKFLWMVRIGSGVFPEITEQDYLNPHYRVDEGASEQMMDSLVYKLSYYRFAEYDGQGGNDRVRKYKIGRPFFDLKYFEEAFTTSHWMLRVYKVLDVPKLDTAPASAGL